MGCGGSKKTFSRNHSPVQSVTVALGRNVKLLPPAPKVIFIFGGPGSGKGRILDILTDVFKVKVISFESCILKYLNKATSKNIVHEIADIWKKEYSQMSLGWVLNLVENIIESDDNDDDDSIFVLDLIPNLHWILKEKNIRKDLNQEMEQFEAKLPISFGITLMLAKDDLNETLGYSHSFHRSDNSSPPGMGDEAKSSRAETRFNMHEKAVRPFLNYFRASGRLMTVNVSSGMVYHIWNKLHKVFIELGIKSLQSTNIILVFATEGLKVGGVDLSDLANVELITLRDFVPHPQNLSSMTTLLESFSKYIDSLAHATNHYVLDVTDTCLSVPKYQSHCCKKTVLFSNLQDNSSPITIVSKFTTWLNGLVSGEDTDIQHPYFKEVSNGKGACFLFPSSSQDAFCQEVVSCFGNTYIPVCVETLS